MGVTSRDMVALVNSLPNPPVAFGANCGTGASDLLRTVQDLQMRPLPKRLLPKECRHSEICGRSYLL